MIHVKLTESLPYSFADSAAREAREASRNYWRKGGPADRKYPCLPIPPEPPLLASDDTVAGRGLRVISALLALLDSGAVNEAKALCRIEIHRSIEEARTEAPRP